MGADYVMPSAKPLIDTPAETIQEAQSKTHSHPLRDEIEAISSTLFEMETRKVAHTWANRVASVEVRTVDDKLGKLEAEELINTPSNSVAYLNTETRGYRLGDVEVEALVHSLANTLA